MGQGFLQGQTGGGGDVCYVKFTDTDQISGFESYVNGISMLNPNTVYAIPITMDPYYSSYILNVSILLREISWAASADFFDAYAEDFLPKDKGNLLNLGDDNGVYTAIVPVSPNMNIIIQPHEIE